jgi:hypothetical protein
VCTELAQHSEITTRVSSMQATYAELLKRSMAYLDMSWVMSITGAGDDTPPPYRDDVTLDGRSRDVIDSRSLRFAGVKTPRPASSDARFCKSYVGVQTCVVRSCECLTSRVTARVSWVQAMVASRV